MQNAAGISPHEVRYHFTDISPVPQERISLKKPCLKTGFFGGPRGGGEADDERCGRLG